MSSAKSVDLFVYICDTHRLQLWKAAYAIKNSTTIILPEWFAVLDRMVTLSKSQGKKPLSKQMMPRDVATRWNYTYEMLNFAYNYRDAYNELCANRDMKMRKYEIKDYEWEIVRQLADILKVNWFSFHTRDDSNVCPAFQRCHCLFFSCNSLSCQGDPSNGSHRPTPRHCHLQQCLQTMHSSHRCDG